ncbi:membrane protease YdiL (CAAX protease family) [Enterococcus sp. PF1-24]|uniref:CPBP family intramembrane glutamic endopeptidase n=1 Tax=unclassified Enterococcus TaxID=2608891 RepID=UPI0024744924|nr:MULTISPECIES: CPBP family intramembrane glutamic endopeptidase [unclassified Enterococcus]MDH6363741.1 membrane protease YdiL (CAAX protease family) [Enterococcus sp. PFB1-1]MDH6400697.1 membrane protease YdiL (CAAX protease family) [Enterococcus sp. PF1-24]
MIKTYLKLVGAAIALTMVISVFSAASVILQLTDNGIIACQIAAFLLLAVVLFLYMKKQDASLQTFGFTKKVVAKKIYGFIALVVAIQPIILGIDFSLSLTTIGLIVIQMILVGFVEESLFRSIFRYYLKNNKPKTYLLFSSIIFGVLHLASGLNPDAAPVLVLLQIVNALLLGLVFALLYYHTQTIYLVMIFHSLFNIFASITLAGSLQQNILAVTLLTICYISFLAYYFKKTFAKK